eukprot:TRINITY_DN15452_c0_g1_i1.p1 TRINITY_DN15452_c0_g1~~TRINITY_DN15452_c0_g1_i1.p1  ORF type:complete len:580 (+),score=135.54 TRINITY_DN15452_c0_g1_i1:88-1827(+)
MYVSLLFAALAVGGPPTPLSFHVTSASCPLAWTRVPVDKNECGQGAFQEGLTTTVVTPPDLTTPDSLLVKPKAQLPRGCLVIDNQLSWNPGGSDVSGSVTNLQVVCTVTGMQPPVDPPVFVLPPFIVPSDFTKTPTLIPPQDLPTPTLTIPDEPTPTLVVGAQPTPSPPRGPAIVDVNVVSQVQSNAACIEFATLNPADNKRKASSTYYSCTSNCAPNQGIPGTGWHKGRLDGSGWVSTNTTGQWYELDAGEIMLMSGVVLQGANSPQQVAGWSTGVTLLYSRDTVNWNSVEGGKTLSASHDLNSKISVKTEPPFAARHIRIGIVSWVGWVALRAGILQCARRAISIGGVEIVFDQPTQIGTDAVQQGSVADSAYEVLRMFGVSGSRQTFGRPEGFTGTWRNSNTYVISFTNLFNGRVDPLIAQVYIADTANITNTNGDPATGRGLANGVSFNNLPPPSPIQLPQTPVATPKESDSESSSDFGFLIAAVIIIVIIICIILVWCCATWVRRSQETDRHKEWIHSGRLKANQRMPRGVSSAFDNERPPRDDDDEDILMPPSPQRQNPILFTFPERQNHDSK